MTAITYEMNHQLATITMNDGRANIMSEDFITGLIDALATAKAENATVILRSSLSGIYSAGFDVRTIAKGDAKSTLGMVKAGGELIYSMLKFPRGIIAVVEGKTYPMGLFTVLAADYRIGVAEEASWGLNEVEIGIVPPKYAFELLRDRLPNAWVNRALVSARRFTPSEGLEAGVFDEIIPDQEVERSALKIASRLSKFQSKAVFGIKRELTLEVASRIRSAIDEEQTLFHYERINASS